MENSFIFRQSVAREILRSFAVCDLFQRFFSKDSRILFFAESSFKSGKTPMAMAVWNGQNKERNGQKGVTHWQELKY